MVVAATRNYPLLLVLPVRIFGMLQVPQRTTAPNHGNLDEVVVWRRRANSPLQRPRIPRIVPRRVPFEVRPYEIHYPEQEAGDLKNDADGDDEVPDLPSATGFVGINAARHAQHARYVHEVERQMETNEEEPEMPLAESLVPHPPCETRLSASGI